MGYRTYIGYMPKREYNKIKSLTKQELFDFYNLGPDDYKGVSEFGPTLYEFGKSDGFKPPKGSMTPFFKKKDTQKYWSDDHDFFVVTKDFMDYVIETYKIRIQEYYREMIAPFSDSNDEFIKSIVIDYVFPKDKYSFDTTKITSEQRTGIVNIINHIRSFSNEWLSKYDLTYNLTKGDEVTTSWKYEYAIFELVRIYKTFDWKRNVMLYYGY
jgi:hypothetical protein